MPPSTFTKPPLLKSQAEKEVKLIIEKEETGYQLIPFKEYRTSHQGSYMRSQQYNPYYVLVYPNSRFHAGWAVCPYVLNGFCEVKMGLLAINTKRGGTNRFGAHIDAHNRAQGLDTVERPLQEKCREEICNAAAAAVVLDLRPYGFAENHDGMVRFAQSIFKAGQTVPFGVNIDKKSYIPSRTGVKNAVQKLAVRKRQEFAKLLQEKYNALGGAITIDGVNLKLQNRHYYDFTIHHFDMKRSKAFLDAPVFGLKTTTILFIEGPAVGNAANIRHVLDSNLKRQFGMSFEAIQKNFSIVTDGAAVMACVAGSSVSRRLAPLDQTWMRCFVHVLNCVMKAAMADLSTDTLLTKVSDDFKAMKRIVKHAKKNGWNSVMPDGYRLIQEIDTRFGTYYLVAERFLKSASKVWDVIRDQNLAAPITSFESIHTENGAGVEYPTIEAIIDAFKPVYDATIEFQTSTEPMLHKVLPAIQHIMSELSNIEHGLSVVRDDGRVIRPSLYSMRLCSKMKQEMEKVEIHDLWLVACFLYPYLRDMSFWDNAVEREQFKVRAENLTRSMYSDNNVQEVQTNSASGVELPANPATQGNVTSSDAESARKKRRFSLQDHVSRAHCMFENGDEVSTYKSISIRQMGLEQDKFLNNPFSIIQFWYQRRRSFPQLYKISLRIFATPASSCASERVFSTLKKLVSVDRARMDPDSISDIIVARSLMSYDN